MNAAIPSPSITCSPTVTTSKGYAESSRKSCAFRRSSITAGVFDHAGVTGFLLGLEQQCPIVEIGGIR